MRQKPSLAVSICLVVGLSAIGLAVGGCGGSPASTPDTTISSTAVDPVDLGTLIEAENTAIYAYGVIGAHLNGPSRNQAQAALKAHERLRDDWIQAARDQDQEIPPAAIAYDLPIEVHNSATAESLAVEIETRLITVYQSAGASAAEALARAQARLAVLTSAS